MTTKGIWTQEEHDRFLQAIKIYPQGPWRVIAKYIGSRSVRQVQTHAQKYHEKIQRRMRGLQKDRKTWARTEHRIDQELLESCRLSTRVTATASKTSVLLKFPTTTVSFGELLKQANGSSNLCGSPLAVGDLDPLDHDSFDSKLGQADAADAMSTVDELPSFTESLDFLIEYLSD